LTKQLANRRSFLAVAVSVPMLSMGTSMAIAQTHSGRPSLGFSLYGMKTIPLDVALETCAEIGYSHVEFSLNPGYATEPSVFNSESRLATATQLCELELELPCLMVLMSLTADDKTHASNLELIATAGQLARDLVADRPPILETVLGGNPAKWQEQKAGMIDQLHDWAAAAEKAKTVIALKAHVGSAVNSPDRLLTLVDEVKSPALQLAYDYSHFELQGIDMAESMKLLLPRTQFIHVKDSQGDAGKFKFLLPGEGRTDYVKYFSLLKQHGYVGPVCVEVSGQVSSAPDYNPIAAAKQCHVALSNAMLQAYAS
jgi:sugar phosphate isomerase/epimerase